jgi:hypothetical protein
MTRRTDFGVRTSIGRLHAETGRFFENHGKYMAAGPKPACYVLSSRASLFPARRVTDSVPPKEIIVKLGRAITDTHLWSIFSSIFSFVFSSYFSFYFLSSIYFKFYFFVFISILNKCCGKNISSFFLFK